MQTFLAYIIKMQPTYLIFCQTIFLSFHSLGSVPYSGGRSRLHLIDLSYVNQNFEEKTAQAPSHAALGQIIITMLNGNKKVTLFKDSKICRLLKDSIGNLTCRSTVIAHVSSEEKNYRKTLQTLNITQKIQRKRRKRNKVHYFDWTKIYSILPILLP